MVATICAKVSSEPSRPARALLKICVPQKQAAPFPMRPSNSEGQRNALSTEPQSLVRTTLEPSICVTGPRLLPRMPTQDFATSSPGCRFWFLPLGQSGRKTNRRNSPVSKSRRGWPPLPEPNKKSLCISRVNPSVCTSCRGINTILYFAVCLAHRVASQISPLSQPLYGGRQLFMTRFTRS